MTDDTLPEGLEQLAGDILTIYSTWVRDHSVNPDLTVNRVWFLHFVDAVVHRADTGRIKPSYPKIRTPQQ